VIEEHCELVAISRGKANLRTLNPMYCLEEASDISCLDAMAQICGGTASYPERPLQKKTHDQHLRNYIVIYEFYNVLWVEWKGGVTYRRALGRVFKKVWESVPREEVDIILG
jgi:hypothetical protein